MATATLQSYHAFLTERLTAAAADIFGFVEKTILDYQTEVYRTKQENQRLQRLLDLVYQPEIRLRRADSKQRTVSASADEISPKQQEWTPSLGQEEPGPSQITVEEKEELWTNGNEEQPSAEDSDEGDALTKELSTLEDSKQRTVSASADEISPKQQEWTPSLGQEEPGPSQIKVEEKEELWTNGNEEQPSVEDSDEGDALTKELIKTVQQLEDSTANEKNGEPKLSLAKDPNRSKAKMSGTTFYRCHICNYIFTNKTALKFHLKTHESKGNFDCQICGKHTPCQSNLQNHMRVHTGERPHTCHYCGKCFKLKGHMTEHLRTHTGEKPFSCHICEKSFNRASTLRKHVFIKHKEERPYKL